MGKSSMDAHEESRDNIHESPSVTPSSLSCNSSCNSYCSSSSSSSSFNANVVPLSELHRKPYPMPDHLSNEWMRFSGINNVGHGYGMDQWKEIEKRFNKLAITANGSDQHVVKWSDFGFCIGMQQSPEFANELLRALRGIKKDLKNYMTKGELYSFWLRLNDPCYDSRIRIFFDLCDRNMDGKITASDIKESVLLSASTNKLSMTHEEAEDYASLVMEFVDTEKRGYIEVPKKKGSFLKCLPNPSYVTNVALSQKLKMFRLVPLDFEHFETGEQCDISEFETLFRISLAKGPISTNRSSMPCNVAYETCQEPSSKAEILFRSHWRRGWIVLLWLAICLVLFTWKFMQYRHRAAFEVMGYCLSTAKGAAETLKFNMALVLLPVCRNTITWLRNNPRVNSVIPFNDNINFHKLIAGGIVVGVILHGGTHLACDFPRISSSNTSIFQQTIAPGFGYHQPSYLEILATTEVATGIVMVILMAIAFSLATKWPRRQSPSLPRSVRHVTGYNTFWYSHHLFIPVYALLIIHSMFLFLTNNVAEKTAWMYIAIPMVIYAAERILRAIRSGCCEVQILKMQMTIFVLLLANKVQASFYPGKVLSLKLHKPEGFRYQSGMYIFIQCPQISPLEWHPFSLTSGPEDEHLSVHIRTLGDWSYQIYNIFQEAISSSMKKYPKIYIDGPYGAASQDHVKYDMVVLIGLGIGATPFISILKDVVNGIRKEQSNNHNSCSLRKGPIEAYLYWVTREQSSFDWFRDIMKEISKSDQKQVGAGGKLTIQSVVEVHNFLTSIYQEGDARSAFISAIQALYHAKHGIDIISGTPVRTHFARPDWFGIFSRLAWRHRGAKIGVFYCGPSGLAKDLERLCTKFSTKTTTRFVFHKENY